MIKYTFVAGVLLLISVLGGREASAEPSALPETPTYKKPFLTGGGAMVGGYMDLEFKAGEDGSTFDQHRFVPFIYAEVSDRVHVASEIEFEHGGFVSGEDPTDGEIKIEFATMDFTVTDALNFRGGVILSPLGRLNAFHDAPMLDLTERPLLDRNIIPTTLSESGIGFFGVLYPSEMMVVDYEVYLVNGFNQDAVSSGMLNIRSGRGSQKSDNNNSRAVAARLGVSPSLGTNIGLSVHSGDYDDAGDNRLNIAALDGRFAQGPFEILGEYALAEADVAAGTASEGLARGAGFYVEGKTHFLAGALASLPQSVFTATVRLDYVDMDRNAEGSDVNRWTFGLNFRPTEETVFKNDILLDRSRASGGSEWGDTETSYRFSLATYF